jgi:hypothetical protein
MKPNVHTIIAKQDDLRAMGEFLRQIPDGQQFRLDLAPGREYQNEGYARGCMTGYYLYADGAVARCLIVNNLFAHQHEAIAAYYTARRAGNSARGVKDELERALGLKLDIDPAHEEIDQAIKRIEKYIGECASG